VVPSVTAGCDVSDTSNAGTLTIKDTPNADGTDSVSFVCEQSNPSCALTVTAYAPATEECTGGPIDQCEPFIGNEVLTSSDGKISAGSPSGLLGGTRSASGGPRRSRETNMPLQPGT
jgi:hypothetical protein